jgi:small subunit ribosomal protein S6
MRKYEGLLIIDPNKEESLKEIVSGIKEAITKQKGKVDKEENWGKQRIAYSIKKNKEGIYYKLDFSANPAEIAALKNSYKLNPDVLRIMITAK